MVAISEATILGVLLSSSNQYNSIEDWVKRVAVTWYGTSAVVTVVDLVLL